MSNYNIYNEIRTTIHDGSPGHTASPFHVFWVVVGFMIGGVIFLVMGLDWDFLAPAIALCVAGPIVTVAAYLLLRKFWKHILGTFAACGIVGLMGFVAWTVVANLASIMLAVTAALAIVASFTVYAVAAVLAVWATVVGTGYIREVLYKRQMKAQFLGNLMIAQQHQLAQQGVKALPAQSSVLTPVSFEVKQEESVCQER